MNDQEWLIISMSNGDRRVKPLVQRTSDSVQRYLFDLIDI